MTPTAPRRPGRRRRTRDPNEFLAQQRSSATASPGINSLQRDAAGSAWSSKDERRRSHLRRPDLDHPRARRDRASGPARLGCARVGRPAPRDQWQRRMADARSPRRHPHHRRAPTRAAQATASPVAPAATPLCWRLARGCRPDPRRAPWLPPSARCPMGPRRGRHLRRLRRAAPSAMSATGVVRFPSACLLLATETPDASAWSAAASAICCSAASYVRFEGIWARDSTFRTSPCVT